MPIPSAVLPGAIRGLTVPMHRVEGFMRTKTPKQQLQSYTGDTCSFLYPQLKHYTPEERFDSEFKRGTKLSNEATLIRPTILSLGETTIKKNEDGSYLVTSKAGFPINLSEKELLKTKWLARGAMVQNKDNSYTISYIDRNDQKHFERCSKQEAMKILEDNMYHM